MPDTPSQFDIAICGAGPVGLTIAALLQKYGVSANRITVLDARPPQQPQEDPRSIALSYGSCQILQQIHAWPIIAQPIAQIHVSRRGYLGRTLIDRKDYGLPALGYVARYSELINTLSQACQRAGVHRQHGAAVTSIDQDQLQARLQLATGDSLTAKIVIQAEGGVFGEHTNSTHQRDYQQTAIVAQVSSSAPNLARAYERFTDEGPLALLPQVEKTSEHLNHGDSYHYAMVWCMRSSSAEYLQDATDSVFLAALQHTFGDRVGRFTRISTRNRYPLGLHTYTAATGRVVTIGNAAQTLHPVAGQGLNLGLRDATVLARLLAQVAAPETLQRFLKTRQIDRSVTIRLTDVMARIFTSKSNTALSQSLLGLSLGVVDGLPAAKRLLAEQMMFGWR
jgi:2-octaprenyl-6-methoxyphenol hydroxylase